MKTQVLSKVILAMLFAFFVNDAQAQCVPIDTVALNKAYADLQKTDFAPEAQRAFFDAFPKSWDEFYFTFGYIPPYDANLCYTYVPYLRAFGKLTEIPTKEYCERLISMSWGGHWEADAVNYLQDVLRKTTMKHIPIMLAALEEFEEKLHFPFWYFFFHSVVSDKRILQSYASIRDNLRLHKRLSVTTYDLAFTVAFGNAPIGSASFPTYREMKYGENRRKSRHLIDKGHSVFMKAEQDPEFIGGETVLQDYIHEIFKLPANYEGKKLNTRICIDVIIDRQGNVTDPEIKYQLKEGRIIKEVEEDLAKEAIRVVMSMPRWTPATVKGEKVAAYYSIGIDL